MCNESAGLRPEERLASTLLPLPRLPVNGGQSEDRGGGSATDPGGEHAERSQMRQRPPGWPVPGCRYRVGRSRPSRLVLQTGLSGGDDGSDASGPVAPSSPPDPLSEPRGPARSRTRTRRSQGGRPHRAAPTCPPSGILCRAEFIALCRWKSPRAVRLYEQNSAATIRRVSRAALGTRSERARLSALLSLKGVGCRWRQRFSR